MRDPDPLVKPRDAAARLHTSVKTVYRLAAGGHLDTVRVSPRGLRVRERSLEQFIDHGYQKPDLQEAN